MNVLKYFLFVILTAWSVSGWTLVFESDRLESLQPYFCKETLVIFDYDNTLVESEQHLGSAQWRSYIRAKALDAGFCPTKAEEMVDRFWQFVQPLIRQRLVQSNTLELLRQWKTKPHIDFIVLTAREPLEKEYTFRQLSELKLDFSKAQRWSYLNLVLPYPGIYEKGVIFAGENDKGTTLEAYLQLQEHLPKRIVFIDDKKEQIDTVQHTVERFGIEFIGIRYSATDKRVHAFNPLVAERQWLALPKLISDEDAAN